MAVKHSPRGVWWSRLHFVIRFLGLTGLLVGGIAVAAALVLNLLPPVRSITDAETTARELYQRATVASGDWTVQWTAAALLLGVAAALFAVLIELLTMLRTTAARRGAFGFNVLVQVILAATLLAGLNLWSFHHGHRFDFT